MSFWLIMLMVLGRMLYTHGKRLCLCIRKNCGNIFSKIVQHGQIYFSMSPSDQLKFRKTHLYNHLYKMNIKEIKWGLDQMWTRVILMVKEGQNDVTLTTTITLVVDISAMAQWYTGYNGLYTGYRSLFLSYSKNRTYSLRSIVLDAKQISYYYPFRNQWRRFLFRINEKL